MSQCFIHARIDRDLKMRAKKILTQLGILPSQAVKMFFRQIVLTGGIPFHLKAPPLEEEPAVIPVAEADDGLACGPDPELPNWTPEYIEMERRAFATCREELRQHPDLYKKMCESQGVTPIVPEKA